MSPVTNKEKPRYWRSLAELEQSPELEKFLENEFTEPAAEFPPNSPERRRFLELMGASFALAGATTGCRWQEDYILPSTRRPEGLSPGEPRYFSTSMDIGGFATGLLVKSYDGRPIKVEGNPNHPDSHGAAGVFQQASILELYDPDRSRGVATYAAGARSESSLDAFKKTIKPVLAALRAGQGRGFRILSESSSSQTVADMKQRFKQALPEAKWY